MPISIENIVVFSAGGAVGYLVRTIIDHNLAKSRGDRERSLKSFNDAAKVFRDSFTCVYQAFPNGREQLEHIVINNIEVQEVAMIEFSRHLSGKCKSNFEKAWDEYKQCNQKFLDGYDITCTEQKFLTEFKVFIDKLIDFAKQK